LLFKFARLQGDYRIRLYQPLITRTKNFYENFVYLLKHQNKNPNIEYRNPKQYQNSTRQRRVFIGTQRCWVKCSKRFVSGFVFWSFEFVSDLGFRASDFVIT
jgi:hypothetical protein